MKIPEKAVVILQYYEPFKEENDGFVFPELKGVDLSNEVATKRTIAFKTSPSIKFCVTMLHLLRGSPKN